MNHRKILFVLIALVILMAFVLLAVSAAGASEERTLWQRVSELELQNLRLAQRIAALEACNPIVCDYPATAPDLALPPGVTIPSATDPATTPAPVVTTPPPVVTTVAPPTATPTPETTPTAASKQPCNQGRGNGPEGCDPGNSNNHNPSNDENPNNRGGKRVP